MTGLVSYCMPYFVAAEPGGPLMPAELLIRPGHQDGRVIADLLAPGGAGRTLGARCPISRLVLDAAIAHAQPGLAENAHAAGVSVVVDPMTFLLQCQTDPDKAWSRLPFADAAPRVAADFGDASRRRDLVRAAVDFQVINGATGVVPPYFQAASPTDPWFDLTLACLADTAAYLRAVDIRLPVLPVLAGRLDRFARPSTFPQGIDRFAGDASDAGAMTVALQLGPVGHPDDTYARLINLFQAATRLRRPGLAVHAWRQGTHGPALVAAGLQGYETGIGVGESTDLAAASNRAKPKPAAEDEEEKLRGGPGGFVYIPALHRSIPTKSAEIISANLATRALLLCDDQTTCCPDGLGSMLGAQRRHHAVRSRARYLAQIDRMPQASWRIYKVGQDARAAVDVVTKANSVLVAAGKRPLNAAAYTAVADAADYLRGSSAVA